MSSTDTAPSADERRADFGIITALRDELTALRAALSGVAEVHLGATDIRYYYRGRLSCRDGHEATVVCACSSEMGQQPASNVTRDLIAAWKPRHVFLAGIAGGFPGRGVSYGDVVAPLRVHYYEPGKLIPASVESKAAWRTRIPRWRTLATSPKLGAAVEAVAAEDAHWLRRVSVGRPDGSQHHPRIFRDELASGEEVWASLDSGTAEEVLAHSDKILAVENEAYGFLSAVQESAHGVDALVTKALSDLIAGKDDRWRAYAASVSAAFAVAVIEKLGARWRSGRTSSARADRWIGEAETKASAVGDMVAISVPELRNKKGHLDAERIADRFGFSRPQLAGALRVSQATLYEEMQSARGSPTVQRELAPLARIAGILDELLPGEPGRQWLNTALPALKGRTPLQALLDGEGERVAVMLEILRDGPSL